MKIQLSFLFSLLIAGVFAQDCEELTLKQEVQMTENIALVSASDVIGDSIQVDVVKKWKGDSIPDHFLLYKEAFDSEYFVLDSGKTYLLFWYHGLSIDRCSRSSDFKYVHFEYELDELFQNGETVNVLNYDSLKHRKNNVFKTVEGRWYDRSKGTYAFFDLEDRMIKSFEKLPKDISWYYPIRYYEVDSNIQTSSKTYEKVFAVSKTHRRIQLTNKIKKEVLIGVYE